MLLYVMYNSVEILCTVVCAVGPRRLSVTITLSLPVLKLISYE